MDVQFTRRRLRGCERDERDERASERSSSFRRRVRAATELQKLLLLLPYRLETFVERATDITRPVCTLAHRVIRRCDSDDITGARARAAPMLVKYRLCGMENSPEDLRRRQMRNRCAIKGWSARRCFPPRYSESGDDQCTETQRSGSLVSVSFYYERSAVSKTLIDLNIIFHVLFFFFNTDRSRRNRSSNARERGGGFRACGLS